MGILSWIIVGLLAGWIAGMMTGGGHGLVGDVIIGISGALLGGDLAGFVFRVADGPNVIDAVSLVVALVVAVSLIAVSHRVVHPRPA